MHAFHFQKRSRSGSEAMSRLGFFFLPGAPPGRVLATCQEWRSEEKLVSEQGEQDPI